MKYRDDRIVLLLNIVAANVLKEMARNGPAFMRIYGVYCIMDAPTNQGNWESTREAREAFGFASCHTNVF